MNDKTTELLESLAIKLGTTAEYLWGVLINQAFVSATTDMICAVIFTAYLIWLIRWFVKRIKNEDDDFGDLPADLPIAVVGGMVGLIVFILILLTIPNIITGYMNPEYWALEQILRKL